MRLLKGTELFLIAVDAELVILGVGSGSQVVVETGLRRAEFARSGTVARSQGQYSFVPVSCQCVDCWQVSDNVGKISLDDGANVHIDQSPG